MVNEFHFFFVSYDDDSSHIENLFSTYSDAKVFFDFLLAKSSILSLSNVTIREEVEFKTDGY